jgi:uncharacterized spore protein YtfJ
MKIDEIMQQGRDTLTVKQVFGEPFERDGVAIIPAAVVRGGGGGGSGEDMNGNHGGGGGYGLSARPVGAYQIKDGKVTWIPALDLTRVILVGQVIGILFLLMTKSVLKRVVKKR